MASGQPIADGAQAPGLMLLGPAAVSGLMAHTWSIREACGVVFGEVRQGVAHVHGWWGLRNASKSPSNAYEFDAEEQAAAWQRVADMGLEVLGIWHTHPSGPPHPSQTDVAYMQPWLLYIIMTPDSLTVWRLREDPYVLTGDDQILATHAYELVPHEVRVAG